jgi:3',5'-cyclic AMP phosphodiesterase CpdA
VAIPGNHDGDIDPQTAETSLEGFVRNFCSQAPVHTPEAQDATRTSMTQPYVYWTPLTPLVTIIGLYSNCSEGGQLSQAQINWFESELGSAPKDRAVIVAVHHPIYSAYGGKPGSSTSRACWRMR